MRTLVVLLLILLPQLTATAEGQVLRVQLVVPESNVPIAGAYVVLTDSAGRPAAAGSSGSLGRFILRPDGPGRYLLQVSRIGYRPWWKTLVLKTDETLDLVLSPTTVRVALPTIHILGDLFCGARAREDSLSSFVWDQARIALLLNDNTLRSKKYHYVSVLEEHRGVGPDSGWASTATVQGDVAVTEWPVRSPSPDVLHIEGFIGNRNDLFSGPTWYGPDAAFLLSEDFFDHYCFRLVGPTSPLLLRWAGRAIPDNWIGLSFQPGRVTHRSSIQGVIWLDRKSAELRRIEWTYTRLPNWARGRDAGGRVDWALLPDGGWIAQRWMMRVPVPTVDYRHLSGKFAEYRDWTGYVQLVRDQDGAIIARYAE